LDICLYASEDNQRWLWTIIEPFGMTFRQDVRMKDKRQDE